MNCSRAQRKNIKYLRLAPGNSSSRICRHESGGANFAPLWIERGRSCRHLELPVWRAGRPAGEQKRGQTIELHNIKLAQRKVDDSRGRRARLVLAYAKCARLGAKDVVEINCVISSSLPPFAARPSASCGWRAACSPVAHYRPSLLTAGSRPGGSPICITHARGSIGTRADESDMICMRMG